MAKMAYAEQLKHPKWQRKRLEMLSAADFTCKACGTTEKTLHVHHKQYVKGRMAWEYSAEELAVLCEDCHEDQHKVQEDLDYLLNTEWLDKGLVGREIVLGFLAGFLAPFASENHEVKAIADRALQRDMPFFDLGFMVAALGPDDLAAALRRKRDEGSLPNHPFVQHVLGEESED
jgi:hypothetical protein